MTFVFSTWLLPITSEFALIHMIPCFLTRQINSSLRRSLYVDGSCAQSSFARLTAECIFVSDVLCCHPSGVRRSILIMSKSTYSSIFPQMGLFVQAKCAHPNRMLDFYCFLIDPSDIFTIFVISNFILIWLFLSCFIFVVLYFKFAFLSFLDLSICLRYPRLKFIAYVPFSLVCCQNLSNRWNSNGTCQKASIQKSAVGESRSRSWSHFVYCRHSRHLLVSTDYFCGRTMGYLLNRNFWIDRHIIYFYLKVYLCFSWPDCV